MFLFKNIYVLHPFHYAENFLTKRNLCIKNLSVAPICLKYKNLLLEHIELF